VFRLSRPGARLMGVGGPPPPAPRTRFVSFWSDADPLMAPVTTARIEHPDLLVENVLVSGVGHLALPIHSGVAAGIRHALDGSTPATSSGEDSVPTPPAEGSGSASVA
ncbi:lipase, partial [Streptomyces sp. NPDC059142]